jgi:hypothetical protein
MLAIHAICSLPSVCQSKLAYFLSLCPIFLQIVVVMGYFLPEDMTEFWYISRLGVMGILDEFFLSGEGDLRGVLISKRFLSVEIGY